MAPIRDNLSVDRRRFLAGSGVLATLSGLPVTAAAPPDVGTITQLGDFEDGLDGWRTSGRNRLDRVTDSQFAGSVTHGTWALAVRTDGDPHPMIDNRRRVREADLLDTPHLVGAVVPVVADAPGDIVFRFRLHHTNPTGSGNRGGGGGGKPVFVVESPPIRVPQFSQSRIYWDMSDLDDETLANPVGLDIAWHHADHPPEGGPRGTDRASFDYRGYTLFDNIHLTDDPADIGTTALRDRLRDLRLTHGRLVSVETDSLTGDAESGQFRFSDGSSVPYSFDEVGPDRFVYAIGDQTFKLGGGW